MNDDQATKAMDAGPGGYDIGYRSTSCFWGIEASSLVKRRAADFAHASSLRVLDAGCGEGKNAAFFAQRGADVDAFDISPHAVRNAERLWSRKCPAIRFVVSDVESYPLTPGEYDVVVLYGLLHCLPGLGAMQGVVDALGDATRPGGLHIVCALNSRLDGFSEGHRHFRPAMASHHDYLDLYAGWCLADPSDSNLTERHAPDFIEHTHAVTRFYATRQA